MSAVIKLYGAPGTGKTTEMLRLLEEEIANGTPIRRIAFVTHTIAARDEARKRCVERIPSASTEDFKFFKTIHGICYLQIGLNRANVIQTDDYVEFGNYASIPFSRDFTCEVDEDGLPIGFNHSPGNEILAIRQLAEAWDLTPFHQDVMMRWPGNVIPGLVEDVLDKYSQFKEENSKFDFVDMLNMYLSDAYKPLPIDVLFIDEAQDLSRKQWAVVHKFMGEAKRVYLAGDDDQSIYGFIGADPMGFYHHPCDKSQILPRTYRLPSKIWNYASDIIGQVAIRQDKTIDVKSEGGEVEYWNRNPSLIEIDPEKETMIIARHHIQLTDIASLLAKRGTPFMHRGRTVVGTARARAVHAYFRAKEGENIPLRAAAELLKMIGEKELSKKFRDAARTTPDAVVEPGNIGLDFSLDWVGYLSGSRYDIQQNENLRLILNQRGLEAIIHKPKVDLTTYHASKGREADHIILLTDCFRAAWDNAQRNPDDERRLAYVGATRAKERVTIVAPTTNLYMRALV